MVACMGALLAATGYFTVAAARLQDTTAAPRAAAPRTAPAPAPTAASTNLSKPTPAAQRAILNQYCVTCHNEKLKTGGLALDTPSIDNLGDSAATWEKVAHMLRTGAMPPTGRPRPDAATSMRLASWLEEGLDQAAATFPNA